MAIRRPDSFRLGTGRGSVIATVVLLALGFAVLGALLVLDKAVFLDPLPFKATSGLALLQGTFTHKGEVEDWGISHIDFLDWRQQNRVFEQMAAFSPGELAFNLMAGNAAERLSGELVSYNYFPLLGVRPAAGRFFTAEEDGKPFTHPVVVLSHGLWQRRFGGDPAVVGRTLDLNGQPYRVVGVAPRGFRGLTDKADAWIPSAMPPGPTYVANRRMRWLEGIARLKPGATLAQAQRDMDRVTAGLAQRYPEMNKGMGVRLSPFRALWFGELGGGLRLLTLGAALALLFAVLDAAALLAPRRPSAAGAPLAVRQIVARAVAVSLCGGALGLALAAWLLHALLPRSGLTFPSFLDLTLGWAVIGGVLALALLCGVAIGLAGARADR